MINTKTTNELNITSQKLEIPNLVINNMQTPNEIKNCCGDCKNGKAGKCTNIDTTHDLINNIALAIKGK